jgi:hypothetical protein
LSRASHLAHWLKPPGPLGPASFSLPLPHTSVASRPRQAQRTPWPPCTARRRHLAVRGPRECTCLQNHNTGALLPQLAISFSSPAFALLSPADQAARPPLHSRRRQACPRHRALARAPQAPARDPPQRDAPPAPQLCQGEGRNVHACHDGARQSSPESAAVPTYLLCPSFFLFLARSRSPSPPRSSSALPRTHHGLARPTDGEQHRRARHEGWRGRLPSRSPSFGPTPALGREAEPELGRLALPLSLLAKA